MLKALGALCVAAGAVASAFSMVSGLSRRAKALQHIVAALDIMQAEIGERLTPLPELVELLSKRAGGAAALFFTRVSGKMDTLGDRSFLMIWTEALGLTPELQLTDTEAELMLELGSVLGRYDAEAQVKAISYTRRRLDSCLQQAEIERSERGRVCGVLSVAAGLALIIILV